MPLLRKPIKVNSFKTPFLSPKEKIKDIIDYKLDEPENKKAYNAFVERLSQGKHVSRSSSPKNTTYKDPSENKENLQSNVKQIQHHAGKKNNRVIRSRELSSELSLDTTGSLTQEELNKDQVKSAYIEFMNSSLAKEQENDGSQKSEAVIIIDPEETNTVAKKVTKKRTRRTESNPVETTQVLESNEKLTGKKKNKNQAKDQPSQASTDEGFDEEFTGLTVEEKMDKLHQLRNVGLYVLCDLCDKQRYLPHVVDPLDLPDKWYCTMNPDPKHNKCSDPEKVEEDEEFLIINSYNAGSIVFAKMHNYPWWPAMVEDDPDTNTYFWLSDHSMIPTYYHVTFFDSLQVSRQWIPANSLQPFKKNIKRFSYLINRKGQYKSRLEASFKQAEDAIDMPPIERLRKYGFFTRFNKKRRDGNNNKKGQNKKRKMTSLVDNISEFLGNVSLSDLSFNFLD